jgi:hypothetical protein
MALRPPKHWIHQEDTSYTPQGGPGAIHYSLSHAGLHKSGNNRIALFDKMLKFYGVMLQFEFLRGPLDWGLRLLGKASGAGVEGAGRVFDGAGVAFNTCGEVEIGSTYPGPPGATMTRVRGAFDFAPLRKAGTEGGVFVPASIPDAD